MTTGDWCVGKTKETDEKVAAMAKRVSEVLRNPELRKRLDDKKRNSPDEVLQKINGSHTNWVLLSPLSEYTRQNDRNLLCVCARGHEVLLRLIDIVNNVRCKVCHPVKNAGSLNPAFKNIEVFRDKLLNKFNEDAFLFDPVDYGGLYRPIELQCAKCRFVFTKAPRALLQEVHGCPACSSRARSDLQRRTMKQFMADALLVHGNKFTYNPRLDQTYGNADTISWTCNDCKTTNEQSVANHLGGNSCSTCSEKKKHTTESFVAIATHVWGDVFDYSLVNYVNNKVHVTLRCRKRNHTFSISPSNHFSKRGCPHCAAKKFVSVGETEWLDSLSIPHENRNKWIDISGQKFNVDGLINGTIYEYYGDYWHGNPKRFDAEMMNTFVCMSMKELHEHTMTREDLLREGGYVVIRMWEFDWMTRRNTRPKH